MNLKTLYELKEVLDFCGYHDTIVEDMTNRGIDLESLEDKVNHEQKGNRGECISKSSWNRAIKQRKYIFTRRRNTTVF